MKILRQVLGIDVSQKELVVCMGRMHEDLRLELYRYGSFLNSKKGFDALIKWAKSLSQDGVKVHYVMEATGVYHESLAYFLEGKGLNVSIILPNKISNYFRTLDVKQSLTRRRRKRSPGLVWNEKLIAGKDRSRSSKHLNN